MSYQYKLTDASKLDQSIKKQKSMWSSDSQLVVMMQGSQKKLTKQILPKKKFNDTNPVAAS